MKQIDVKNQRRLSLKRCFDLVLSGVQYRLFRAAITVAIVALAVAFLMTMLTESLTAQQVAAAMETETAPRQLLLYWVDRVTNPMGAAKLTDELAEMDQGGARWQEFAKWGSLNDEQLARLQQIGKDQRAYRRFFADLDEGQIRPLVGRARGPKIFEHLQDKSNWEQFATELPNLSTQLPTDLATFQTFLTNWKETQPMRQAIIAGQVRAIRGAGELMGQVSPNEFFATASPEAILKFEEFGYVFPKESLETVRQQASLVRHARMVERMLAISVIKNRLAGERNTKPADVTAEMLFDYVSDDDGAEWLLEQIEYVNSRPESLQADLAEAQARLKSQQDIVAELEQKLKQAMAKVEASGADKAAAKDALAAVEAELDDAVKMAAERNKVLEKQQKELTTALADTASVQGFDIDAERIQAVADYRSLQDRLREVEVTIFESDVAAGGEGFLGFSTRTMWLVVVSFMVCVVGIANAMLMSVTERFREIATMKCLGATDGFIMINFILESCMQGVAGGVIGTLLGLILGLLRSWGSYGLTALANIPWSDVFAIGGLSLVMGIVLSAVAAVYPAWVAARLAPMEAMRIE